LPRAAAPVTAEVAVAAKPSRVASGPVRSAFTLSSDHQALIREALIAAADHELLEHEPRDDPWASDAEQLIRQELARHESAGNIDVVAVDCRQTVCAIQAFAYGENGHRAWVDALDELYRQTLAGMFDSINTAFPTKGTRSAVLTFLHRARRRQSRKHTAPCCRAQSAARAPHSFPIRFRRRRGKMSP
jgi:hypothetical protein